MTQIEKQLNNNFEEIRIKEKFNLRSRENVPEISLPRLFDSEIKHLREKDASNTEINRQKLKPPTLRNEQIMTILATFGLIKEIFDDTVIIDGDTPEAD